VQRTIPAVLHGEGEKAAGDRDGRWIDSDPRARIHGPMARAASLCVHVRVRSAPFLPRLHLFVCTNRRDASSPLGSGCAERGDAVYVRLKDGVARRGEHAKIWVTQTGCLGMCPKRGATVAIYPEQRVLIEVEEDDCDALLQ
jgi:hypothetical protein